MPKSGRIKLPRTAIFAVAALAVGIAACAPVGPEFVRPDVPLNPDWLETELDAFDNDAAELTEWWKTLDDPVLDQLIETAYQRNNALKVAGLRVLESQARLGIATGNRYPQVQVLAGDASAIGTTEAGADSNTRDQSLNQYNLGVSLSWEMDFWGRFRRGVEAADAGLLASIADYDDVLVLLTAQVADIYAIIRATEEQLRLAQESVDIQQRSYDIVQVLYRNGESSELDALQAAAGRVDAQQGQVGEVVLGQGFRFQMGVHTAQAREPPRRGPQTAHIGNHDFLLIAGDDIGDFALTVHQQADLATDLVRQPAHFPRQFRGDDLLRSYPAAVKFFQPFHLAGFQPLGISIYFFHDLKSPPFIGRRIRPSRDEMRQLR